MGSDIVPEAFKITLGRGVDGTCNATSLLKNVHIDDFNRLSVPHSCSDFSEQTKLDRIFLPFSISPGKMRHDITSRKTVA